MAVWLLASPRACLTLVPLPPTDPYLNIDAGTMSPFEHGEVFVLDDGGEVGFDRERPPGEAAETLVVQFGGCKELNVVKGQL